MIDLSKMSLEAISRLIVADQDLKLDIADNMKTYGGSFVQALSQCMLTADNDNLYRLTQTFMDYVLEYQPKKWKREGDKNGKD